MQNLNKTDFLFLTEPTKQALKKKHVKKLTNKYVHKMYPVQ